MNILMLNPPFKGRFSRSARSPAVAPSGTIYYPLWLAYATGVLEEAGFNVRLIDAPAHGLGLKEIIATLYNFPPSMIVLDSSTPSIFSDVKSAETLKENFPQSFVVIVGTHVSALPEETLRMSKKIDAVAGAFYLPIEAGISKKSLSDLDEPPKEVSLKATGILNGQFSENLDRDASGRSKYYNFAVSSKDNHPYSYYSSSGALKPNDFTKILDHTKSRITELAEAIFSGKIDITPYRLSNSSPCTYCDYLQLCRFDWQINKHNMLDSMGKLQTLQASGGGDG